MRHDNVKTIIQYYRRIPGMVMLLKQERDELEDEYNGLRGTAMDGMPHGGTPGKPTEALAVKLSESGAADRLQEIDIEIQMLEGDAANIRGSMDALNSEYKRLISMRYLHKYSWVRLSMKLGVPESTARRWHGKAVERLGDALDDVPMVDEILGRASRART